MGMTHNEINQNIIGAINILVESALSQANFDKTISAVIVSCTDEAKGKYKVKYQDATYYATSDNTEVKYSDNTEVYILIPGNDFSKEKKILGTVKDLGEAYIDTINQGQMYEIIGGDAVYGDNSEIGFCSYRWKEKENTTTPYCWNLYTQGATNNKIDVDETLMKEYAVKASQLKIGASFKTNLDYTQRGYGNYGLKIDIDFKDPSDSLKIITRSCILDINQMLGTPYNFRNYSTQDLIFDIDGKNYVQIKSIDFIMYEFKSSTAITLNDIFIKDIVIAPVAQVKSELLLSSYLTILDNGSRVLNSEAGNKSVTFQAKVVIKGKEAAAEDLQCYWFIAHSGLSTSHRYYNSIGGQGWRCLNGFLDRGDSNGVEWQVGKPIFTVTDEDMQANKATYKCVCIYEGETLSKEFEVINAQPVYTVEMTAQDNITKFEGGRGYTSLKLQINGADTPPENLIYYWSKRDSSDVYTLFDATGNTYLISNNNNYTNRDVLLGIGLMAENIQNAINKSKVEGYPEIEILRENDKFNYASSAVCAGDLKGKSMLVRIICDMIGIATDGDEIPTVKQAFEILLAFYQNNPITYVYQNEFINLPVNSIVNFNVITCSIFEADDTVETKERYLGSASIRLENNVIGEDNYNLTLIGGNQTFKYNATGLAPTHPDNIIPQIIEDVSFHLFDKKGVQFSEQEIKDRCEWTWKIPKTNTLITSYYGKDENGNIQTYAEEEKHGCVYVKNARKINFTIEQTFAFDSNQNDIELELRIKRDDGGAEAVKNYTNFSFLKDGLSGTNGTGYYCRIAANLPGQTLEGYPIITCIKEGNSWQYYLNTGLGGETRLDTLANKQWFRAELYNNGSPITSGATITWSMLDQETLNLTKDSSTHKSISILDVDNNGNFKITSEAINKFLKQNGQTETFYLSNILQARAYYDGKTYYATLPIAVAYMENKQYRLGIKANTGFNEVVYSAGGDQPQYSSAHPFEMTVTHKTEEVLNGVSKGVTLDVADSKSGNYIMNYNWDYSGNPRNYEYEEDGQTKKNNYHILMSEYKESNTVIPYKCKIEPYEKFDGRSLDVGFICHVTNDDINVGTLYFPIHMHLNRFGFANLNDWNGSSVKIKDGEYLLAPQVGAGFKDPQTNAFTGLVMGVQAQPAGDDLIGLLGYSKGERTIFLDADTGKAEFGKQGGGQIILDPTITDSEGKPLAQIYSGNYFDANGAEAGEGLLIDLTTPQIKFGSGNFNVDAEGKITSKRGMIGGWNIGPAMLWGGDPETDTYLGMSANNISNDGLGRTMSTYRPKISVNGNTSTPSYEKTTEHVAFWAGNTAFRVSHSGYVQAERLHITNDANKDGSMTSVDGVGYKDVFISVNYNKDDTDATWTGDYPCIHSGSKTGRDVNDAPGFYLGANGMAIGYGSKTEDHGRGIKMRQNGSGFIGDWDINKDGKFYTYSSTDGTYTILQGPRSASGDLRTYALAVGAKKLTDYSDAPFRVARTGQLYAKKAWLEEGASLAGKLVGTNADAVVDLNAAQKPQSDSGSNSQVETDGTDDDIEQDQDDNNIFEWAEGSPSDTWSVRIGYDYTPDDTYGYLGTYIYPDKITLYNSYNSSSKDDTAVNGKGNKDYNKNMNGSIYYRGGSVPADDTKTWNGTYGAANFVFGRSIYLRQTALRIGRFGITAFTYGAKKDSSGNSYDNLYVGPSKAFCWKMRWTTLRGRSVQLLAYGGRESNGYTGSVVAYAAKYKFYKATSHPYCAYSWTTSSDERVKNIYDLDNRYIEFFKRIQPITYTFKNNPNGAKIPGYSAQQVKQALFDSNLQLNDFAGLTISKTAPSDYADENITDFHALSYQEFIPIHTAVLQKTLKELEIEQQKTQQLEKTVEFLLQEIQDIKARLG